MRAIELIPQRDLRARELVATVSRLFPAATSVVVEPDRATVDIWSGPQMIAQVDAGELPHARALAGDLDLGEQLRLPVTAHDATR